MLKIENHYNLFFKDFLGAYYPQYELIWLRESKRFTFKETSEHEFFHAYTLGLTPPNNITFYNVLCDFAKQPHAEVEIENFRDIVEASVLVWQKVVGRLSNFKETGAELEYIFLAEEITILINKLSQFGFLNSKQFNLKIETFHGILMLLLHIIPLGINFGRKIINIFIENLPFIKWSNRYELFLKLYFKYNQLLKENPNLRSLYKLNYPFDCHRLIIDFFVFLRVALWILLSKSCENFIPFILPLANVLSLGSLTILPIIYINEKNRSITIRIIHSTEKSENIVERAVSNVKATWQKSINCPTTRLAMSIWDETKNYRIAEDKNRLRNFYEFLLNFIESEFFNFNIKNCDCDACRSTYRSAIMPYKNIFTVGLKECKHLLVDLAERYESWFKSNEGMKWIISKIPITVEGYSFKFDFKYL